MQRTSLVTVLVLFLIAGAALAAGNIVPREGTDAISVPQLINYQGKLTDGSGNPLSGTYSMKFEIFNAATGPTSFWSETQTGVVVTDGLFNVKLGSVNPIDPATELPDGPDCWLEITVGTTVISPRSQLVSVPYTHKADVAKTANGVAPQGSGSGLDADLLDGSDASAFTTPATDAGQSGVATDLYEGTTKLSDKYSTEPHPHTVTGGDVTGTVPGALNIAAGAVGEYKQYDVLATTVTNYSFGSTWATGPTGFEVGITTTGGPVLLFVNTGGWSKSSATYLVDLGVGIWRDATSGNPIASNVGYVPVANATYHEGGQVSLVWIDEPGAGSHTYRVCFRATATTARTFYQNYNGNTNCPGRNTLIALELKQVREQTD